MATRLKSQPHADEGGLQNKTMKGSDMQTTLEVEDLLVGPQQSTVAANEEFAGRAQPLAGWDPFEVWRTRVKAAKEAKEANQSGTAIV